MKKPPAKAEKTCNWRARPRERQKEREKERERERGIILLKERKVARLVTVAMLVRMRLR